MYCDSITLLTMRLMRLGRTRFEAERITASIMTGIVVVLTLMGYRLSFSSDETLEDRPIDNLHTIPGIHTVIPGSQYREPGKTIVDAPEFAARCF